MDTIDKCLHTPPRRANDDVARVSQILLRSLVFATTLTAACLVLTSKQTTEIYGVRADARYTYSPAFQFFTYANIVAFAFSFLSGILALMLGKRILDPSTYFYFFLHDLIMGAILASGCAAALAVGWVGKYGNSHVGWTMICDHFGRFCNRLFAAIVVSYVGFLSNLILTATSARKLHG